MSLTYRWTASTNAVVMAKRLGTSMYGNLVWHGGMENQHLVMYMFFFFKEGTSGRSRRPTPLVLGVHAFGAAVRTVTGVRRR